VIVFLAVIIMISLCVIVASRYDAKLSSNRNQKLRNMAVWRFCAH